MMSFRAERSVVENGAAGEAATWTGRPEAERTGSERIKSRCGTHVISTGSFDCASLAQDDRTVERFLREATRA